MIEKDQRFEPILQQLSDLSHNRLKYIIGDARIILSQPSLVEKFCKENFSFSWPPSRIQFIGNLPFQIATILLIQWLHMMYPKTIANTTWIDSPDIDVILTLMFQKELAERITCPLPANINASKVGRLTFVTQFICEARLLFHINRNQFCPKPNVDASLIQLSKKNFDYQREVSLIELEKVCKFLFLERRKTINTLLKRLPKYDLLIKQFDSTSISLLDRRAEQLDMKQMILMTKILSSYI